MEKIIGIQLSTLWLGGRWPFLEKSRHQELIDTLPVKGMRIFLTHTHILLLEEHYASSSPNIVNLIVCLQPTMSAINRISHLMWVGASNNLKNHRVGPLTSVSYPLPLTCNIPSRVSKSLCHCRGNTHTLYFFGQYNGTHRGVR